MFHFVLCTGFKTHIWARIWSLDLKKKYGEWVVITGATDGVGLEYAREFARRGHSLVLVGRSEAKLAKIKTELSRLLNPNLIATVICDFNSASSEVRFNDLLNYAFFVFLTSSYITMINHKQDYKDIATQINGSNRNIGILVNNAGVMYDSPNRFLDQPEDSVMQHVKVNIAGVLMITRAVLPGMVSRRRGLVINMSSIAGYQPLPLMVSKNSKCLRLHLLIAFTLLTGRLFSVEEICGIL